MKFMMLLFRIESILLMAGAKQEQMLPLSVIDGVNLTLAKA